MGLSIVVGAVDHPDDVAEGETFMADLVADANAHLKAVGLPGWTERPDADEVEFGSFGYSALHTLRRVAVHVTLHGALPAPVASEAASEDPELDAAYASGPSHCIKVRKRFGRLVAKTVGSPSGSAFEHLIHHGDAEGIYVPVEFTPVIVSDKLSGGHLGSSPRLLAECLTIADHIGLDPRTDPESDEVWAAAAGDLEAPDGWQRYGLESQVCLQLIRAAEQSIASGSAIYFL